MPQTYQPVSFLFSVCARTILCLSLAVLPFTGKAQETLSSEKLPKTDSTATGSGSQARIDKAGSAVKIEESDFNPGLVISPWQLVTGQVAGFHVTELSGAPGAGSLFQLQRNVALAGEYAPLVLLDGMQIETDALTSLISPISLLNSFDIASITVLKDAAATSFYGTRGANGVVLITTKQSTSAKKIQVHFRSQVAVSGLPRKVPVLSAQQFREIVQQYGTPAQQNNIGTASTDWQQEAYENAVSHNQNLGLSGTVGRFPYRLSLGYLSQAGILSHTDFKRKSMALSLTPSFLSNKLKMNVHLKRILADAHGANEEMINGPATYNPTQPIYNTNGSYFEWNYEDYLFLNSKNPLGLLDQKPVINESDRDIVQVEGIYSFGFLPSLMARFMWGHDQYEGKVNNRSFDYEQQIRSLERLSQGKKIKTLEAALVYAGTHEKTSTSLDATVGYTTQKFENDGARDFWFYPINSSSNNRSQSSAHYNKSSLNAFFGKVEAGVQDKYFFSASARRDQSSWFSTENRTIWSGALGLGWQLFKAPPAQDQPLFSAVKIRGSYGLQRNLPFSTTDLPSLYERRDLETPVLVSIETVAEKSTTVNIGADIGLPRNRVSASFDFYARKTTDLLLYYKLYSSSFALMNEGELKTSGFEMSILANLLNRPNIHWSIKVTGSYATSVLSTLSSLANGTQALFNPEVFSIIGSGPQRTINSFNLYKQKYQNGIPLENQYEDINQDGEFTTSDRSPGRSVTPTTLLNFRSTLQYQKWSLDWLARAVLGHAVYNGHAALYGNYGNSNGAYNLSSSVLATNFRNGPGFPINNPGTTYSDYYVEDASFLRLEYLALGYDFGRIYKDKATLKVEAVAQNLFLLTKYSGQDPETPYGIDFAQYPRPRTLSLQLEIGL